MPEITYRQLQKAVVDLAKDTARNAEAIQAAGQQIDEEARDTARVAEQIGAMNVDTPTIAETREVSKIMEGLSQAVIQHCAAARNTSAAAEAAYDANRTSHDGINEAFARSPVGAAIYNINRDWLRQE
ncbi:hypothetical protein [Streptomyces sp. NPDC046862]|uniref:hypothetical protein n=1 Tax=Streptomyces sp. NPDC046862 TaxID=3154603 RepID=UPI0034555DB8